MGSSDVQHIRFGRHHHRTAGHWAILATGTVYLPVTRWGQRCHVGGHTRTGIPWAAHFPSWYKNLVQKCWLTPKLWPKIEIQDGGRVLGLPIFHLGTKFGSKILIDAEIMGQNRNPRWRPSAILDFRKSDFWELEPLGLPIFHLGTKFWCHEVYSLGYIGFSNFMLIRCIVLKIQWQTGCSPRPPTLTQRYVVLHAGWSSGGSSKFQISSKSVERFLRFGGVKICHFLCLRPVAYITLKRCWHRFSWNSVLVRVN